MPPNPRAALVAFFSLPYHAGGVFGRSAPLLHLEMHDWGIGDANAVHKQNTLTVIFNPSPPGFPLLLIPLVSSTVFPASFLLAAWFGVDSCLEAISSWHLNSLGDLAGVLEINGMLAQEAAPGGPPSPLQVFFSSPLPLFAGLAMIWYLTWFLPEKRKRTDEANMLASLTKNDRVVTIGGLHGTVVSAAHDSDSVVLKIDEAGTTRVRVNRSAIVAITEHAKGKNGAKPGKSAKIPGDDTNSKNASDEESSE